MRCLAVLAVVLATVPAFAQMNSQKASTFLPVKAFSQSSPPRDLGDFRFAEARVSDSVKDVPGEGYRFMTEIDFRGPEGLIATRCWWNMSSNNRILSASCVFDDPIGTEPIVFLLSVRNGMASGILLGDRTLFVELTGANPMRFEEQTLRFRNEAQATIARFPEYQYLDQGLRILEEQSRSSTMAMALSTLLVSHLDLDMMISLFTRPYNSPAYSLPLTSCPNSTRGSIERYTAQLKELAATEWQALLEAHDRNLCIDRAGKVLTEREPSSYRDVLRVSSGIGLTLVDTTSAQDAKEAFSRYSLALGPSASLGLSKGHMLYLVHFGFLLKSHRYTPGAAPGILLALPVMRAQASYTFLRMKYLEGLAGLSLQLGTRAPGQLGLSTGPMLGLHIPIETPHFIPFSRVVLSVDAIPQVGFWSRSLGEQYLPAQTEFGVQVLTGIRLEL